MGFVAALYRNLITTSAGNNTWCLIHSPFDVNAKLAEGWSYCVSFDLMEGHAPSSYSLL